MTQSPQDNSSTGGAPDNVVAAEVPEKHRRLTVFLSALAFFVGYVLSAGPVVFIVKRFNLPMVTTIVEFLYAPLIMIVKLRIPLISSLIQSYVKLFE